MFTSIFLLISFLLLSGFLLMLRYESRRKSRFFASQRARIDRYIERLSFILTHVDFPAFLRDESRRFISRVGHDSVQWSLRAVRAVERALTRLIRYLRTRHAVHLRPREQTREFVKTLSDFKDSLQATRPKIPDIL